MVSIGDKSLSYVTYNHLVLELWGSRLEFAQ